MKELVIAPSILSLDYSRTSEQLKELDESNAKWMHFDVMDGHFVPNLTFGPDLLKGFKKAVDMVMDVHIMVDNPDMVAEIFAKAGADVITFHLEAVKDVDACIQLCRKIREMGVQAGICEAENRCGRTADTSEGNGSGFDHVGGAGLWRTVLYGGYAGKGAHTA